MRAQSSDSYSIVTRAFGVLEGGSKLVGYGVWAGAPGDIGLARVTFYGLDGAKRGSVSEVAND
jgi:hypothetical protein